MKSLSRFPWWFLLIVLVGLYLAYAFYNNQTYAEVFDFVKAGLITTIQVTLTAYAIAITIGLLTGLARVSKNPVIYNIATLYVQVMRGVPILVTLLYTAFVVTPWAIDVINSLAWEPAGRSGFAAGGKPAHDLKYPQCGLCGAGHHRPGYQLRRFFRRNLPGRD